MTMKPMKSVVNMGPFKEKDNWDKPKLTTNLTTISKKVTTVFPKNMIFNTHGDEIYTD